VSRSKSHAVIVRVYFVFWAVCRPIGLCMWGGLVHAYIYVLKSAFLNGDLKEEVYVHQPSGFVIPGKEGKVLRLRKTLYDLRQAPMA
jgi:hypothetical protein